MILNSKAVSKLCLGAIAMLVSSTQLYAVDYIWTGSTNNDLFNTGNWNTAIVPGSADLAQFRSGPTNISPTVTANGHTFGTIYFGGANVPTYNFDWNTGGYTFTLDGDGVTNVSSIRQYFNINNGGELSFTNSASADSGYSGNNTYYVGGSDGGTLVFNNDSTTGSAQIFASDAGVVIFNDSSVAEDVTIIADSTSPVIFHGTSQSNNSYIQSTGNATGVTYNDSTVAGNPSDIFEETGIFLSDSKLQFLNASDPSNSYINASGNSQIVFNTSTVSGNDGPYVVLYDTAEVVIAQDNMIASLHSTSSTAEVVLGTNTLTTNESTNIYSSAPTEDTYAGLITGTGTLIKTGVGTLTLTGVQNPADTWSAVVNNGTLFGDTTNLNRDIDIVSPGTVNFGQSSDGTYTFTISGDGTLVVDGTASLIIDPTSDNSGFTGTTNVIEGTLQLDGSLGGKINVLSTLIGTGTAFNTVEIKAGGTIEPGDSIGTMTVGDFIQDYGSFYEAEVNGAGLSDLVLATTSGTGGSGTATLNGGTVNVSSPDGTFLIGVPYTIVTAQGGLTGTFQTATTSLSQYLLPLLSYNTNNAFVTLNTSFQNFAAFGNAGKVARQFDSITNPSADLQTILQNLVTLTPIQLELAFDELSGEQYATLIEITQLSTRRFLRDLFFPFRMGQTDCHLYYPCCEDIEIWVDGHYGRSFLQNHHNRGFKTRDWDVVVGAQTAFDQCWTVGAAFFYQHNCVDFNEHGRADVNNYDGAIYGYYRDDCYYLASDLLFGYSRFDLKRTIRFADIDRRAHSHPKFWNVTFYTEAGTNYSCSDCLTLQPFIGLESDYYNQDHFREHGADSVNLKGKHNDYYNFDSRLGVRAATTLCCDVLVSAELAWEHRYTENKNSIKVRFEDFGHEFSVTGPRQKRDAIEGSVLVAKNVCDDLRLFFEAYGERWQRFSNYDFALGIDFRW